jgi:hypothetical protein
MSISDSGHADQETWKKVVGDGWINSNKSGISSEPIRGGRDVTSEFIHAKN